MSSVLKVDRIQSDTGTVNVASKIEFPVGSASAPSIFPTGDTNTGIFFPAADQLGIATNGVERVKLGNSETVFNDGGANVDFRVEGDTDANLLFVDASTDRVGIGTGTPGFPLDVVSDSLGRGISLRGRAFDNVGNLRFVSNDGLANYAQFDVRSDLFIINNLTNSPMAFFTNDTERARITSGGFFKASNEGTYDQPAGAFHYFQSNQQDNSNFYVRSTNASLASAVILNVANRSQSDAYQFLRCFSNSGTDTEILLRGDGNGYADGTWNNNGADYAEFFESVNGQALTLGATVVLDGNKVREATDQDPTSAILGVVRPKEPSKASMMIGNTAWNKWANKYLTDDFDRYIMEDHDVVEWEETITDEEGNISTKQHSYESQAIPAGITVPTNATRKTHDDKGNKFQHYKLNPAWNPDSEYVNRENRPEWNIIGLLGQVKILKGQPVGDRWIKMRDVSETVEEWFIR